MQKHYVLDANILLHDPASIFNFDDNVVIVPLAVIEEIDRFKRETTDRGYNARAIARTLDKLRAENQLTDGVTLPGGGIFRVHVDPDRFIANGRRDGDTELLLAADAIQKSDPNTPVVIVTKDINLRIRADVAGLKAEDYETDQVRLSELESTELAIEATPEDLNAFKNGSQLDAPANTTPNEYVLVRSSECSRTTALGRINADCTHVIPLVTPPEGVCSIKPRNKEQYYAIDALLDESIQLVTLMGKAGTGKTLIAIASAMHATLKQRRYRGALVARPVVPLGRDIGFLPGDLEHKLEPWMKPITDTIDFLLDTDGPIKGKHDSADIIASGLIEIQPLTYIRGRSIAKRFVLIDEAQNLTPLEVKTIITRIGQDAKVVLTGDPHQIDNPYVDANSNGFSYLVNRMRSQPLAAHVALRKGERSSLAELAANLL